MTYVEKSLGRNERIVHVGHFHWLYYLGAWLALIFFGPFVVGIFLFVGMMIRAATTDMAVTTSRAVLKTGWLRRHTEELPLGSIEEVRLEQGVLGRLFGYGNLTLTGTGEGKIAFPPMADPVAFRAAVENARVDGAPRAVIVGDARPRAAE